MQLASSPLGNSSVILLPSAIRIATTTSAVFQNYMGGKLVIACDVTVSGGPDTIQLELLSQDMGQIQVAIGTAAATAAGQRLTLIVGPGCAVAWAQATSNSRETAPPILFNVRVNHSGVAPWTYQVSAMQIL